METFSRNWPFVRGIHRSPVNFPHKDQWRGALMFSLICVWINDWVNNHEAGDLRLYRPHYDVIVLILGLINIDPFIFYFIIYFTLVSKGNTNHRFVHLRPFSSQPDFFRDESILFTKASEHIVRGAGTHLYVWEKLTSICRGRPGVGFGALTSSVFTVWYRILI